MLLAISLAMMPLEIMGTWAPTPARCIEREDPDPERILITSTTFEKFEEHGKLVGREATSKNGVNYHILLLKVFVEGEWSDEVYVVARRGERLSVDAPYDGDSPKLLVRCRP